jgi:hypothetical protein
VVIGNVALAVRPPLTEPDLDGFYRGCGFRTTAAGLMRLA